MAGTARGDVGSKQCPDFLPRFCLAIAALPSSGPSIAGERHHIEQKESALEWRMAHRSSTSAARKFAQNLSSLRRVGRPPDRLARPRQAPSRQRRRRIISDTCPITQKGMSLQLSRPHQYFAGSRPRLRRARRRRELPVPNIQKKFIIAGTGSWSLGRSIVDQELQRWKAADSSVPAFLAAVSPLLWVVASSVPSSQLARLLNHLGEGW